MRIQAITITAPAVLTLLSTAIQAESGGFDRHRFAFQAGYFLSNWNTSLQVNGESSRNPEFDLEESLGFDEDDETYLLGFEWRVAPRHKLSVGYWDFQRDARVSLDTAIEVGEETYPVGAKVASEWDIRIAPVTYSYAFHDSPDLQLRATVGVHWAQLEFGIEGNVGAGSSGAMASRSESADTDAPLPVLGAGLRYRPASNWEVGVDAGWFGLSVDLSGGDVEGDILTGNLYVEYALTDALHAGLKYTYFDLDVDAESDKWDGGIDFEYQGPQVYLGLRF